MDHSNPELIVLPFQARLTGDPTFLTFTQVQTLRLLRASILIERSYPGAPQAVGWTIFRRTPRTFLYEGEMLHASETGARKRLRQAYAIQYSLVGESDALTCAHLDQ
ncbi:MAG: hypothetical protein M5U11_00620 [Anaerolineales bacterium]|nr:hypothetical protein [Anaerolineales bacterium]